MASSRIPPGDGRSRTRTARRPGARPQPAAKDAVTERNHVMQGPRPLIKNLADPDEVLTLEHAVAHTVQVGDLSIGRLVMQPGWRWSTDVRPLAGTDSSSSTTSAWASPEAPTS